MTSGYSVPCTRKRGVARCPPAASSKTRMNSSPMALRFSSGSMTPVEPLEEPVGGPHVDQLDALVAAEGLDDLLALALAHEAGVDEHAGELAARWPCARARRPPPSRRRRTGRRSPDRRRPAPGSASTCVSMIERHRPRGPAAAGLVEEVLEHLLAVRRVHDLGVELHAVEAPARVLERGDGHVGGRAR